MKKKLKERIEKLKYRIDVAGLIIQILNFIKSFIKRYRAKIHYLIIYMEVRFMTRELRRKLTFYINVVTLILLIINIIRSK